MNEGHEGRAPGQEDSVETATPETPRNVGGAQETPPVRVNRDLPPPRRFPSRRLLIAALLGVASGVFAYFLYNPDSLRRLKRSAENVGVAITGRPTPTPDPYAEAVKKLEEDRGEPAGRQAKVEIPKELRQYSDSRRFLAIQKAAANESGIRSPHDFAELVEMIAGGRDFVEMPKLGRGYALYGVGLSAAGGVTHYETRRGESVPLFADEAGLKAHGESLAAERTRLEAELKDLDARLKETPRREKEARKSLLEDIAARKKALKEAKDEESLLAAAYGTPKKRGALFGEYGVLAALARDFGGRAYSLGDTDSEKEFQARLLTHIRPAALVVVEELGSSYQSKFGRPLPVTSLVRTEEYQRRLRESGNPNAADTAPPPHTTGLAFDVYYRYMTAAEQEFVMAEIARLERDGRVEALRELRDHYHVFVFPEGRPPDAKAVERVLKGGKITDEEDPEVEKKKADEGETKGRKKANEKETKSGQRANVKNSKGDEKNSKGRKKRTK
jgi:hypothetical protein